MPMTSHSWYTSSQVTFSIFPHSLLYNVTSDVSNIYGFISEIKWKTDSVLMEIMKTYESQAKVDIVCSRPTCLT
jgi:hypothetical protein